MPERSPDRRVLIAVAALDVLAKHGARGLTHRAIDRELGLPDGSTSYYFPTREALLLSAATRLVELDTAEIAAANDLDGVTELLRRWLSPPARTRQLARLELMLAAARDPAFEVMRKARKQFIARVAAGGSEDARISATAIVALADGLILHGLVLGVPSRDELRRALERIQPLGLQPLRARPSRAGRAKPVKSARRRPAG